MKRLLTYLSLALMLLTKVTEVFAGQAIADADGYWIVGTNSSGTWSNDKQYQLTDDNGTLTVTFANPYKTSGTRGHFVIATSRAFADGSNTVSNWGNVIRPWDAYTTSLSGDCGEFENNNNFSPNLDAYDNIKVTVVRSNGTFTFEGVNNTTTATLEIYGGSTLTSPRTAAPFHFYIHEGSYTKGDNLIFTIKTEQGSTTTYYGNSTTFAEGPKTYTVSSSSSSNTCTYTVPSNATGTITVSLLENLTELVIAHQTSGGGGTSTGYYLVGDLNAFGRPYNDVDWDGKSWGNYGAVNKVLKFMDNGDGTYSLRIPAAHPAENENEWDKPSKEKQDVSHQFVIAPENAFSGTEYSGDLYTVGDDTAWKTIWGLSLDWSKVLRPTSNNVLNNAATNGSMAASGSTNWEAKMNGGSYTITINPSEGTWSVTNDKYTHVMYVISKQDGYWRASYLTDVTTGDDQAYDHNHGNKSGELSEFPNESGSTVYVAHNWYEHGSNKKFSTKEHLTIFGAWNTNGDLAPVTWINATSGATAKSIFPTPGKYSTAMDPTRGTTGDVTQNSQKIITNDNQPSIGNITGKKGDDALISPDATLSPASETWDNYSVGTPKTLTVEMNSHATGYKYSYGASSTPSTAGTSTTFGDLLYDGTDVKLNGTTVAAGTNTVTFYIQGTNDTSEGAIHDYTYTFNPAVVSNLDFTPKGGFFINKAVITVTNGTAPYTYTIKDDSDNVLSTGTSSSATFTISTPGKLTVTDKDGNTATSTSTDDKFDFTYSTSENYANYYNNGTTAQSVAQEGGKNATNIFLKEADYKNMRIYAWDYTYDQLIQKYQKGETKDIDSELLSELSALGLTSSTDKWKDIYENGKFIRSEKGTDASYKETYNNTRAGFLERDPYVMLTEPYPGTLMSDSRSIKIDGEKYYYLTLPKNRLHFPDNSQVGIIVTRNDDNPDDLGQNADLYKTGDRVISSNKSFIYSSVDNGNGTYTNNIVDISDAVAGTNVVFYKTSNWSNVKIHLYNSSTDINTAWDKDPDMKKFDGNTYYYADAGTWKFVTFHDAGSSDQTNDLDYGGGRKMYEGKPATGNKGTVRAGNADYITYIGKPSSYTVEVQNHPNGDDYLRAMPSDKTVLLDPTWGGVLTSPLTNLGNEETSVPNWNGVSGSVPGYRKMIPTTLTQTVYGLDNSKTYTVQAIVRVWGELGDKVALKVGDGDAVECETYNSSGISYVNKNGRVDDRYSEGPDPDDPYFISGASTVQGWGWQKIEASGKPTAAGNLVITLTPTFVRGTKYDLADVILLEDANTKGHYWTKLPTDATSVDAIKKGEIDMQDRDTYNAFSFFDRNEGNPNAIIKASNRTVIGLRSGIADVQAADGTVSKDAVDHIQSRNTISLNEGSTTDWSGRYLYLYDESSDWSDCNAYGATVDFKMMGVKYDRQFTANQHSTMFLPFAVKTEQLKTAGFTELQMVNVDKVTSSNIPLITWNLAKETPTDYTTTAGQGYIVIAGSAGASLSEFIKPTGGINVQAANSPLAKKTEAIGLVGAYKYVKRNQTEEADGTTYMNYSYLNDKFRALATKAQGGAEIKPFRATFAVPKSVVGEARMLSTFNIDADEVFTPTGVDKLGVEEQLSGNIYTLDGRLVSTNGKLSELSRGIYVRGGRKIVVK